MKPYAENRKAWHDYEILESFEAGIELFGFEVPSVRAGQVSLAGSYAVIRGGEAFLTSATVTPVQTKNTPASYDPMRPRKLLLSKKQLQYLTGKEQENGLTIVPLKMYNKARKIKVEIALARGKQKGDKREALKKRAIDRDLGRTLTEE